MNISNKEKNVTMSEGMKHSEAYGTSFIETSYIPTSLILSSTIKTTIIDT